MCFFLDRNYGSSGFIISVILVGTLVTFYQQFDQFRTDLNVIKEQNSNQLPHLDQSLKNIKNSVERLREHLHESETEVKKLRTEIKLYKTDKTGLVDYAYGGRVLSIRQTETMETEGVSVFGFRLCGASYLEGRILQKSVMPGDCWPFKGQEGVAVIELIENIYVTKVSLEHAPADLLPKGNKSAMPKTFSLWGLSEVEINGNGTPHFFGQFVYLSQGPEVQTFAVTNVSTKPFKMIEIKFHSNHGNPDFTCVYRVRVHGHMS